jgi:uncharacterized protein (DUF2062 family)
MNPTATMPDANPSAKKFWQRRVLDVIVAQLKQGITPQKISLTIALGITLGIFPILGATTLLCFIFGIWLKLNQPIIQAVNYLVSALQLALILVFVRIGEFIACAQPVSFSIPELFRKFHESPLKFFHEFGMTGLHGIIGWLLLAPEVVVILYFSLLPFLKKLARRHHK